MDPHRIGNEVTGQLLTGSAHQPARPRPKGNDPRQQEEASPGRYEHMFPHRRLGRAFIRTGEMQAWFLAEHLVDTPLVRVNRAAEAAE
jgi:hypothetical protein